MYANEMVHLAIGSRNSERPLRAKNMLASVAVVATACIAYSLLPHGRRQMEMLFGSTAFSFTGGDFLLTGALTYSVLLTAYFLSLPNPTPCKSLRFWRIIASFVPAPHLMTRKRLSEEDRIALFATLLKAFFGPLMAMSLMSFSVGAVSHGVALVEDAHLHGTLQDLFDQHGFWLLMKVILFVDVLLFTLGYLVELPQLENQIRSVDPTLIGWAAALLCYPPFNSLTGVLLGSAVTDFPQFDNAAAHVALNATMLVLLGIYASASVSLGFKASNLTHRGIVQSGPYRLIRHPAYTCKSIAWWIGSAPMVAMAFHQSTLAGIQTLASVIGWTLLYVLRAFTEEDHLRTVDFEYTAYAAKVRYRFIPGIV